MTGSETIQRVLADWLARTDGLLVGENVSRGGGVAGSCNGLAEAYPDAVKGTPVGPRGATGIAIGMATAGRPVVLELTQSADLPAIAGSLHHLARLQHTEFRPTMVVRVPFDHGAGHWTDGSLAGLLRSGVSVHVATAATVGALLTKTLGGGVHVVLEPADLYSEHADPVDVQPGVSRALTEGPHLTLATYGSGVDACVQAARRLEAEGIGATVVDLVTLSPVDPALFEHVQRTGRLLTVSAADTDTAGPLHQAVLSASFLYLESPLSDCHAAQDAIVAAARDSVHY